MQGIQNIKLFDITHYCTDIINSYSYNAESRGKVFIHIKSNAIEGKVHKKTIASL